MYLKIAIFVSILIAIVIFVSVDHVLVASWLEAMLNWIKSLGIWGAFLYIGIYAIGAILFLPGLILTLGAGYIFSVLYGLALGIAIGTCVVFIGATIGAIAAMLIGRYALRSFIETKTRRWPKFVAVEEAIDEEGLKLVLLLRLCPIIPFNGMNYFMGITTVRLRDYALGSFGMLPGTIAYVYFGSALGSISQAAQGDYDGGMGLLIFGIIGSVLAIIAICYVSYIAKKKINSIMERKTKEEEEEKSS
jgi:uncharacterized membrane protein YdjX (TVP38/TMEM64 family)